MRECRSRRAESRAGRRMLSRDRIACGSLLERRAVAANSRRSTCEVRYKSVGFGHSDRLNLRKHHVAPRSQPSFAGRG